MMRHGSARRLSTMLMYGGIALLCYVLLLLRRAERQHAKLQQFNTEFESRIVEPVVERRTALATSAQLGADDEVIPRLPDVCDQVAGFLARIQQKLEPAQAVPLLLSCAERLAELREHSFAVDRFYNRVLALCDELRAAEAERGAAALAAPGEEEDEDDDEGEEEEAQPRREAARQSEGPSMVNNNI